MPGEPGYVPPGPGEPGYVEYAWEFEELAGLPIYGRQPFGGYIGAMWAPSGFGGVGDLFGPAGRSSSAFGALNCCLDKDDPFSYVHIGYATLEMDCGDIQGLTVVGYNEACEAAIYTWAYDPVQGTLVDNEDYTATYTAPAAGSECETPVTIYLYCNEMEVNQITIDINICPTTAEISYTSQQMAVNEQQTLLATTSAPGCGIPVYDWAIVSGGGSLSLAQGASTVYTAPATNPECANNPTIELSCNGVVLDSLKIAVNAVFTVDLAARWCCDGNKWYSPYDHYGVCFISKRCTGVDYEAGADAYCQYMGCVADYLAEKCASLATNWCVDFGLVHGQYTDQRTPAMITAGCCPAVLL